MPYIRKVDSRNRITIPFKIIEALGPGELTMEVRFTGDKIIMKPYNIHCNTCGAAINEDYRTVFLCSDCFKGII